MLLPPEHFRIVSSLARLHIVPTDTGEVCLKVDKSPLILNFGEFTIKGTVQLHQNGAAAVCPAEKNRLSVQPLTNSYLLNSERAGSG